MIERGDRYHLSNYVFMNHEGVSYDRHLYHELGLLLEVAERKDILTKELTQIKKFEDGLITHEVLTETT